MNATESQLLEYIEILHSVIGLMGDKDAIRAVRTIKHLEARINEIQTGRPAGAW
jgi:hypothetical protein